MYFSNSAKFGCNGLFEFVLAGERIGGLQSVASDAQHRGLVGRNAFLTIKLARAADGDAARGFGEDALCLRQQLDALYQFGSETSSTSHRSG